MKFKEINIEKDRETIVEFRKDSFAVSFGDTTGFDEEEYISCVKDNSQSFPEGFVLVEAEGQYIGQLELTIRQFEDRKIGYVNLYYLIPDMRGKGLGKVLHDYAKRFFENHNVNEYHLRVSPSNHTAINFYRKNGMEEVGLGLDGKVMRMRGYLKE